MSKEIINEIYNTDNLKFYENRRTNFEKLLKEEEKAIEIPEKFNLLLSAFVLEVDNDVVEKRMLKLCEKDVRIVGNVIKLYPNNFELNLTMSQHCLRVNNLELSMDYLYKCKDLAKTNQHKSIVYFLIGNLYFKQNQVKNAYLYFQLSNSYNMSFDTLNMIAVCSIMYGNYTDSLKYYKKIDRKKLTPEQMSDLYTNLAFVENGLKNNKLSYSYLDKAIETNPRNFKAFQNKMLQYLYDTEKTPKDVFEESLKINSFLPCVDRVFERPIEKNDLKFGILTGDLNKHPVYYFIKNFIEDVKPFIYTNGESCFKDNCKNIENLNANEACELIMNHKIDVLIDLSGYTNKNRADVLALKPAPFIINYLGYPATTGLSSVNYRISDYFIDINNQKYNSEKLILFKNSCFLNFNYFHITTPIKKQTKEDEVVFGSFNKIQKINEEVLELWREVLEELPNSKIVFKNKEFSQQQNRDYVLRYLPEDRIEFLEYKISSTDHYEDFNRIDVMLDTFCYSGTTTICDSLCMGVPVITLLDKERHQQSVSACILQKSGLEQYIAKSKPDYLRICRSMVDKLFIPELVSQSFKNGKVCDYSAWKKEFDFLVKEFIM